MLTLKSLKFITLAIGITSSDIVRLAWFWPSISNTHSQLNHPFQFVVFFFPSGSPSPCAPIVLGRPLNDVTPYQTVNFERPDHQSTDWLIFLKHTRMVIDIDGGSLSSNARLVQYPQKRSSHDLSHQRFRLHPVADRRLQGSRQSIPRDFIR